MSCCEKFLNFFSSLAIIGALTTLIIFLVGEYQYRAIITKLELIYNLNTLIFIIGKNFFSLLFMSIRIRFHLFFSPFSFSLVLSYSINLILYLYKKFIKFSLDKSLVNLSFLFS